jgi:hypothetical protein
MGCDAVLNLCENRVLLQEDRDEEAPQKKDLRRFLARPPPISPKTRGQKRSTIRRIEGKGQKRSIY